MPNTQRKPPLVLSHLNRIISRVPSPKDDRSQAPKWFAKLLIDQARGQGMTDPEIGEKIGKDKGHVHQIRSGKLGVGFDVWVALADWQNESPGEMLDRALKWWRRDGRAMAALELARMAAAKRSQIADPIDVDAAVNELERQERGDSGAYVAGRSRKDSQKP